MTNEKDSKGESQKQESVKENSSTETSKEEIETSKPVEVKPVVVPTTSEHQPLLDPRTGEPIRDGNPGVPNSPWAGNHSINDVDNVEKEPKISEADFGE